MKFFQMHTNMRDDHAFNINFVQLVERERCLYDKTLPEYRNKDEHDKVWQKIAVEVNENVPHCKERWRNLRACLTRHLKHSKQQTADGSTSHKPYYLAEHMKFVLPYTKCRSQRDSGLTAEDSYTTNSNIQKSEELDDYEDERASEVETSCNTSVQTFVVSSGPSPKKEIVNQSPRFVFLPPANSNTSSIGVKRTATLMEPDLDNDIANSSTEKRTFIPTEAIDLKEVEDADLNFFKSLLPDIRQMTPSQKRKFKMGIFELISNIVE